MVHGSAEVPGVHSTLLADKHWTHHQANTEKAHHHHRPKEYERRPVFSWNHKDSTIINFTTCNRGAKGAYGYQFLEQQKEVCFLQTYNQGWRQLFMTVSFPTSTPSRTHMTVSLFLCSTGSNVLGKLRALERGRVSSKSPPKVRNRKEGVAGRNGREVCPERRGHWLYNVQRTQYPVTRVQIPVVVDYGGPLMSLTTSGPATSSRLALLWAVVGGVTRNVPRCHLRQLIVIHFQVHTFWKLDCDDVVSSRVN